MDVWDLPLDFSPEIAKLTLMKINELFYSLQGEGRLTGMPSVFVRFAGCPLRCRWCDTKYARSDKEGEDCDVGELLKAVSEYPTRHFVFTGGEPMVQNGFAEFLRLFVQKYMHITIETAGINFIPDLPCNLMSISPKLSNSNPSDMTLSSGHEANRYNKDQLQLLIDNYDYQLKYVVDRIEDLDEIAESLRDLKDVNPDNVMLMPQATTSEELIEKSRVLAEYCKQTGFSLCSRLQVLLWENGKGR